MMSKVESGDMERIKVLRPEIHTHGAITFSTAVKRHIPLHMPPLPAVRVRNYPRVFLPVQSVQAAPVTV